MAQEPSGRPTSMRPPSSALSVPRTAALMSAASRPLTQHGLTGLKPSTAGGQRIYKDKRYYISQIHSRNNTIQEELVRLKKATQENKMKTLNLEDMRKKAQEAAKEIEVEQELLATYNVALEMHISKTKEQEVVAEIEVMKRENEMKMKELDNLFSEKIKLEITIKELEKERQEQEKAIQVMVESLSLNEKEEYYKLEREHEVVLNEIRQLQDEINDEKEAIDKYKSIVAESPELQERFQLLQTFYNLSDQKEELMASLSNTQTPAQQQEALLQQVKNDKTDIETLQKLADALEEEVTQMEEKMVEIDKELDSQDNARLKKHKELREREAHMDTFLAGYDERAAVVREKLEESNNQINYLLNQLTENLAELNLEEFGKVQVNFSEQSLDYWNTTHSDLTAHKEELRGYAARFDLEMNKLKEQKIELLAEIERMSNIEKGKIELENECVRLEDENQALQAKYESTQAAVNEAAKRKMDLTHKLEDHPAYYDVMEIQKNIEDLENRKIELEKAVDANKKDSTLADTITKVQSLLTQWNKQLIAKLKARSSK